MTPQIRPALYRDQAIFAYDCAGQIVDANRNFLHLSGYSRDGLIGQPLLLIAGMMDAICDAFLGALRLGRMQQGDFERQGRNGRFATCETHIPVMTRSGKLERVLVLATARLDAPSRSDVTKGGAVFCAA